LGDVHGAMRILASEDSYVSPDEAYYAVLLAMHPDAPDDRRASPTPTIDSMSCLVPQLLLAIKSFSPGSASGFDVLLLQHLQDMIQMSSPDALPKTLCEFVNLVLASGVPQEIRRVFFGASLHAISKKDGGLRPIAIGLTLRRLTSKIANRWATERVLPILGPRQLGVGVRGGAEAVVHAVRSYVSSASPYHAIVKLDFQNAFNTVCKDCIFESQNTFLKFYNTSYLRTSLPVT